MLSKRSLRRLLFYGTLIALLVGGVLWCTVMPGRSAKAVAAADQAAQQRSSSTLRGDVEVLVTQYAGRNLGTPSVLRAAEEHLAKRLRELTGRDPTRESVASPDGEAHNLIAEIPGTSDLDEWVVVGAHYDTAPGTPGGNDNGSGVAATLALAAAFAKHPAQRALRFVLFTNEEPPYFQTEAMGSLVHARGCRERNENLTAMLSLETLGHYSEAEGSQDYPFPFGLLYPSRGNFVAFVGNLSNRSLVRDAIGAFRRSAQFPSEGGALPSYIPGVGWSDHWSFWQVGYPAIMVTDTAVFRDPNYHHTSDRSHHLDFDKLAVIVEGLEGTIRKLAGK
jgi:Zn-dependent M28 family amino/carboxypeptidase